MKASDEMQIDVAELRNTLEQILSQIASLRMALGHTKKERDDAREEAFLLHKDLDSLRAENEKLKSILTGNAKEIMLHSMHYEAGQMHTVLSHPIFYLFTQAFCEYWLEMGAKNYLELEMQNRPTGERFVIRFEKIGMKAPHVLVEEAQAELARVKEEMEKLKAENHRLLDMTYTLDMDVSETGIVISEFQHQRDKAKAECAIIRSELEALKAKSDVCRWEQTDPVDEPTTWKTSCGEVWEFTIGGPNENRVIFCHRCGGMVEAIHVPVDMDEAQS